MSPSTAESLPLSLNRDRFLRTLVRELSGTLQEVVGLEEASGFISVVGQNIGDALNTEYKNALKVDKLSRSQITDVLIDLKRRIDGDFYVIEESDEKIVFGNRRCPFAEMVEDRPALCMMTSNVFGVIASENVGYGKVILEKTIATGSPGCRVTVYLRPSAESDAAEGREYISG